MDAHAYIPRSLEPVVRASLEAFPGILLTGPRQSGKTTMLRALLGESHRYVTLDDLELRRHAQQDPRGFLRTHGAPLIIDEIQYAPELLSAIKIEIDEHRSERGRYVITGSQNILMLRDATETLAGRVAVLRLLPLSRREIDRTPDLKLVWHRAQANGAESITAPPEADRPSFWTRALAGGYPDALALDGDARRRWFSSYVQTYLERDVRRVRDVGDLLEFRAFLELVAARSGQLLQLSDLARELGIAVNTAKAWLSVLEATYQVLVIRPYHANTRKRLIKAPKVYVADTGLLCHLTGLETEDAASRGPLAGALVETAIAIETLRTITHRGDDPRMYHWRTAAGSEVDLLVREGTELVPVEAKTSSAIRPRTLDGLAKLHDDVAVPTSPLGWLVHAGTDAPRRVTEHVMSIPFDTL
ncbi:MAG: ATP-binding protein [Thermoleophilia bacterium]|nr:ATP-binding protein [Thermoleophilia bacterium]